MNRDVVDGELGSFIKEVVDYKTLRGKFSSVHPELRREGIVRVEVGEEGLHFIRDTGELESFTQNVQQTNILVLGHPDSREAQNSQATSEEEEEELLREDIALSLGENNEEDGEKVKDDEEELLKQAIALSLEAGDGM